MSEFYILRVFENARNQATIIIRNHTTELSSLDKEINQKYHEIEFAPLALELLEELQSLLRRRRQVKEIIHIFRNVSDHHKPLAEELSSSEKRLQKYKLEALGEGK